MIKKVLKLVPLMLLLTFINSALVKGDDDIHQKAYEGKSKAYVKASEKYATYLQERISKEWQPAKAKGNLETAVYFEIDKNGFISNVEVTKSNAPKVYQDSCIKTIADLAPFKQLPDELGEKYYFEFTFKQKRNWK